MSTFTPAVGASPVARGRAELLPGVRALHSCLYVGTVRHRRFDAVRHDFVVRLYLAYLDLDELDRTFAGRWWWSAARPAPMWFRRRDYFGPPDRPLADAVRDAVEQELGVRPAGAVRVLTSLRCFGYVFNPVSFYYCFDRDERLVAVLAQITNTPWGERHHYVVGAPAAGVLPLRAQFAKRFHVSPFQPMEHEYSWTLGLPGEHLAVHMENRDSGETVFDATLQAQRWPWSTRNLVAVTLRHPFMTAKVTLAIYWHALRLWWKKAPFHVHPTKRGRQ
ncbi:MAG TPA: DUF1365 domain-containing protein [Planctomycetota bacterium]|nr:DUF1365 domain-containing protein [Planctomycetota bacterium]